MSYLEEVALSPLQMDQFWPLVGEEKLTEVGALAEATVRRLRGRVWWHVNSTAQGGGVAEMLQSLLSYARGLGVETRWLVIRGNSDFFRVTKRLHHALHGARGDGSPLGPTEHAIYDDALEPNVQEMLALVRPGDVVTLHDPQTAGMAPALVRHGATVMWRCHIGADTPNAETDLGWALLARHLGDVCHTIFSRQAYVPSALDARRALVIRPSIDAFSPKNQKLEEAAVQAILVHTGMVRGPAGAGEPIFTSESGAPARVERKASIVSLGPPAWDTPLVVQVSRWDPLKDPIGVMRGFASLLEGPDPHGAHLMLVGPDVSGVTDDPEGATTLEGAIAFWRDLPETSRSRIHLASIPMIDRQENAAIVNAIQRHAAVVVQKSLREGFGLTVTEAMWKGRPVVASGVGGIQDQIEDGVHGLLLPDPADLAAYGRAVRRLLDDAALAARLAEQARERVRNEFLGIRALLQYGRILERIRPESLLA